MSMVFVMLAGMNVAQHISRRGEVITGDVMLASMNVAEHSSRRGEVTTGDVRHTKCDVPLGTNQPQLLSTSLDETVPALSYLKYGICCSTLYKQMYEVAWILWCPGLEGCYSVYCHMMTNGVCCADDGERELHVVGFQQADGASTHVTLIYVQ